MQVSSGNASLANVNGAATLGNATVSAMFGSGTIKKQYTVLSATGGFGGTAFNPAVVSNIPTINASLSYGTNNVFLNIGLNFAPSGGGLTVNFDSDATTPTFHDYARRLREAVPGLFSGRYGLVTEFGRSVLAKAGVVLARVEYAKSAGGRAIAVTHAGAQVATRTVFAPEAWPLRVAAFDEKGRPKEDPHVVQDVAGPCCGREKKKEGSEKGAE